jgi:LysR family transcriptional regulator, transcriptional activator of nhaA
MVGGFSGKINLARIYSSAARSASAFKHKIQSEGSVRIIGGSEDVRSHFYAISAERKIQHPAVVAICNAARRDLFSTKKSAA